MSNVQEIKVNVADLRVGMYVSRLDRPWLETPFLLQGFRINDQGDLEALRSNCNYVFVDQVASDADLASTLGNLGRRMPLHPAHVDAPSPTPNAATPRYIDSVPMEEEIESAKRVNSDTEGAVREAFQTLRNGGKVDFEQLEESVQPMVDSVLRNPDALIWLSLLKKKGSYTYQHSLSVSVFAAAFGRQLGMDRSAIDQLALGALLFDIGKSRLPTTLLNKRERLNEDEMNLIRRHVAIGVKLLLDSGRFSKRVIEMVATHHERYDGSGYPRGLKGNTIPLFGRIAAIVDCFDAITSNRAYASAMSAAEAVHNLYEWRDKDFQGELVEQFIQAIGIYPAGTLVELNNGAVGVVIAQNRVRRLRPRLMLILDALKQPLKELPILDLMQVTRDADGMPLDISHTLAPGSYGIDPVELFI